MAHILLQDHTRFKSILYYVDLTNALNMFRLYKYFTLDSIMYTFYVDLINDKQMCRHKCQWLLTIANIKSKIVQLCRP